MSNAIANAETFGTSDAAAIPLHKAGFKPTPMTSAYWGHDDGRRAAIVRREDGAFYVQHMPAPVRMVPQVAQQAQGQDMCEAHDIWNTDRFPHFVCHSGNWDIYANDHGYCASIPTDAARANGCKATHFGDLAYVRVTLGVDVGPIMVAQPVQQAQGRDMRRGMARCEAPGMWQIGIYSVERDAAGCWVATATGPGTWGDGSPRRFGSLALAYLGVTGEPMPGYDGAGMRMVPQPVQQQQARARGARPARGERRNVMVRASDTGETFRVLTSVAGAGFAMIEDIPSNEHRAGAHNGMLLTHGAIRKAVVFGSMEEGAAYAEQSRRKGWGHRYSPAAIVADPAPEETAPALVPQPCQQQQGMAPGMALIEAAPELLAALRAVMPYAESRMEAMHAHARDCRGYGDIAVQAKRDYDKACAAFEAAKQAIAAATC